MHCKRVAHYSVESLENIFFCTFICTDRLEKINTTRSLSYYYFLIHLVRHYVGFSMRKSIPWSIIF